MFRVRAFVCVQCVWAGCVAYCVLMFACVRSCGRCVCGQVVTLSLPLLCTLLCVYVSLCVACARACRAYPQWVVPVGVGGLWHGCMCVGWLWAIVETGVDGECALVGQVSEQSHVCGREDELCVSVHAH